MDLSGQIHILEHKGKVEKRSMLMRIWNTLIITDIQFLPLVECRPFSAGEVLPVGGKNIYTIQNFVWKPKSFYKDDRYRCLLKYSLFPSKYEEQVIIVEKYTASLKRNGMTSNDKKDVSVLGHGAH